MLTRPKSNFSETISVNAGPKHLKLINLWDNCTRMCFLKPTDFSLFVFFKPGEKFRDILGSAYYMASEVLKERYGADDGIRSAGVILYILLSGVPPSWAARQVRFVAGYVDQFWGCDGCRGWQMNIVILQEPSVSPFLPWF